VEDVESVQAPSDGVVRTQAYGSGWVWRISTRWIYRRRRVRRTARRLLPAGRMNRRGFCVNACQIASLLALGSLFDDCGGSPTSPSGGGSAPALTRVNGTLANSTVTVAVDAASPLASVGGAALIQSNAGGFLAARESQDTINVMTATCTHEACTIDGFTSSVFQCPCHGSQFSTSGSVVRGPAAQSLRRYTTSFTNGVLAISV
jgi:cytochrome b6-f complex iron-sulfur subunit